MFDFLGWSRDRKSVMEIARNYRKKVSLRITGEPAITGKNKIFTSTYSMKIQMQKNVCHFKGIF
jgi:hypothetical protein